jgi:hypothetical protein
MPELFGSLLDREQHLPLHHPRAGFDDRVGELVPHWQGSDVEAVPADQPGAAVHQAELERPYPGVIAGPDHQHLPGIEAFHAHGVAGHRDLVAGP